MFNVGSGEFLVIFLLALIVLGPDKLPEAARKVGKVLGDLRNMSSGFQAEMREAMDVDSIKQALNPTTMMNSTSSSSTDTSTSSSPTTADDGSPLAAAATPVSMDPDVPAPVPAPMPTEIRAAAPVDDDAPDISPVPPDITPAPRASTATPPPAKGQQGAA